MGQYYEIRFSANGSFSHFLLVGHVIDEVSKTKLINSF